MPAQRDDIPYKKVHNVVANSTVVGRPRRFGGSQTLRTLQSLTTGRESP